MAFVEENEIESLIYCFLITKVGDSVPLVKV